MKMVLEHYGVKMSEAELGRMTGCTATDGTRTHRMISTARKLGFKTFLKDNTLAADLDRWLKKGIPVIVDWFSTDVGHYSVAVGRTAKTLWLVDPEFGRVRRMPWKKFWGVWFDFEDIIPTRRSLVIRRMIVIHP